MRKKQEVKELEEAREVKETQETGLGIAGWVPRAEAEHEITMYDSGFSLLCQ